MLQYENVLPLSDHFKLYDLLIPKTNLLRQLNELVDFSFVYDELRSKYSEDTGRSAISPIRMFSFKFKKGSAYNRIRIYFMSIVAAFAIATLILKINWSYIILVTFTAYILMNVLTPLLTPRK